MFKHILVPTDGSDLSQKAIDGAIDLARTVGARMTAYACLPQYPYSPYADVVIELPGDFQTRSEREARAHLDQVEEAARAAGVSCDSCVSVHPSPYLGIIEAAENCGCDVIFMASHGRRGLGSAC
jgi:nucleotide-binding universal stress UspA family protein